MFSKVFVCLCVCVHGVCVREGVFVCVCVGVQVQIVTNFRGYLVVTIFDQQHATTSCHRFHVEGTSGPCWRNLGHGTVFAQGLELIVVLPTAPDQLKKGLVLALFFGEGGMLRLCFALLRLYGLVETVVGLLRLCLGHEVDARHTIVEAY